MRKFYVDEVRSRPQIYSDGTVMREKVYVHAANDEDEITFITDKDKAQGLIGEYISVAIEF